MRPLICDSGSLIQPTRRSTGPAIGSIIGVRRNASHIFIGGSDRVSSSNEALRRSNQDIAEIHHGPAYNRKSPEA
ncbi:hypothetical protein U8C33_37590 (plasmid) [Sinorhizobium meliloti]|nr:hypothetical protein U8C33_37590 [Sinorhizobium meliloti]